MLQFTSWGQLTLADYVKFKIAIRMLSASIEGAVTDATYKRMTVDLGQKKLYY